MTGFERTTEVSAEDARFGFTWGERDGTHWIAPPAGPTEEVKTAPRQFVAAARGVASGRTDPGELSDPLVSDVEKLREMGFFDPDAPVERVETPPPVDLRWRVGAALLFAALSAVSVLFVVSRPATIGPAAGVASAVGFLGTLLLHEFGHAAACKPYFDPDLSVKRLSYVFPAAVTNTQAAWVFPQSRRVWVNLAGPTVDMAFVPAFALCHVLGVAPTATAGLTYLVLARVAFSLNPLIRSDGYWLLVDVTNSTNLRSRGGRDLKNRRPTWPAVYAVLSWVFTVVVVLVVSWRVVSWVT